MLMLRLYLDGGVAERHRGGNRLACSQTRQPPPEPPVMAVGVALVGALDFDGRSSAHEVIRLYAS